MKMKLGEFTITSTYLGNKPADWGGDKTSREENWNNHKITLSRNGKRTSFDFWASIAHPEIITEYSLGNAFECFVSDALSGKEDFENFCSELGYDEDSLKAEKIWKACKKSAQKLERIYDGDLYDLMNSLEEYR